MKNHEFQALVDQNFSGLIWDEPKRRRVLRAVSEEEKTVKKIPATVVLIAAILCISISALAIGLVFSNRVDATRLAEEALADAYGVTDTMLGTFFSRTVEEQSNGDAKVTYTGIDALRYVLGEYTVTVQSGHANAAWNHDGDDTSGLFEAEAWGRDQLDEMMRLVRRDHEVVAFWEKARVIAAEHDFAAQSSEATERMDEKDGADEAHAAATASAYTERDLLVLAKDAVIKAYGLTQEQADRLKWVFELEEMADDTEDYMYYHMKDGKAVFTIMLSLHQQVSNDPTEFPMFTEKDGIYWVDVNVESGVIENILYDSELGGNG